MEVGKESKDQVELPLDLCTKIIEDSDDDIQNPPKLLLGTSIGTWLGKYPEKHFNNFMQLSKEYSKMEQSSSNIYNGSIDPTGSYVAIGDSHGTIELWDLATKQCQETLKLSDESIQKCFWQNYYTFRLKTEKQLLEIDIRNVLLAKFLEIKKT